MSMNKQKGLLLVISGPAGSGKGTVVKEILGRHPEDFCLSVSATTRAPRPGEEHGVHYYFIDKPAFEERIGQGAMLELRRILRKLLRHACRLRAKAA